MESFLKSTRPQSEKGGLNPIQAQHPRSSRGTKSAAAQAVLTTVIPRTRIEEIDRAALQERITDDTTGHSANPELVPTRTRTVSELKGRNSDNNQQLYS
ncbi:hypothetical protein Pst134EA_020918 [Puccinia striiformis f. sp. tritici]|uniref:hypothetical protein n=1 Tax=Puccinia striiformis f. sp. tritici TaxID=168172 RepID=UPI0020086EFF|nr:hypothetical protein Pst134EA_020918 [Puccinia striiformis f. sp. tritici]KAH9457016.1 hypothetical protein Pst134EA_020918 [Puccinia striiformis f. sp. tritici]KAI9621881.1 hypothetical protein KEM48_007489 [Puccinia striiformis f. sp. tritici PST-130]